MDEVKRRPAIIRLTPASNGSFFRLNDIVRMYPSDDKYIITGVSNRVVRMFPYRPSPLPRRLP